MIVRFDTGWGAESGSSLISEANMLWLTEMLCGRGRQLRNASIICVDGNELVKGILCGASSY